MRATVLRCTESSSATWLIRSGLSWSVSCMGVRYAPHRTMSRGYRPMTDSSIPGSMRLARDIRVRAGIISAELERRQFDQAAQQLARLRTDARRLAFQVKKMGERR